MTEHLNSALDELVPRFDHEQGDWSRVVADARARRVTPRASRSPDISTERPRPRRWLTRRRVAVIAIAVAAIVMPLIAAASQDWWFLKPGLLPEPITDVKVVRTGEWDGKPWQLVAYRSASEICYGLTPADADGDGEGGSLSCGPLRGVPPQNDSEGARILGVMYLSGASASLPAYVAGPVVDSADEVEIHLGSGEVIRTPTFDAPGELGSIRFYAEPLPETGAPGSASAVEIQKLVAKDRDGEVVACLALPMRRTGNPLATC